MPLRSAHRHTQACLDGRAGRTVADPRTLGLPDYPAVANAHNCTLTNGHSSAFADEHRDAYSRAEPARSSTPSCGRCTGSEL